MSTNQNQSGIPWMVIGILLAFLIFNSADKSPSPVPPDDGDDQNIVDGIDEEIANKVSIAFNTDLLSREQKEKFYGIRAAVSRLVESGAGTSVQSVRDTMLSAQEIDGYESTGDKTINDAIEESWDKYDLLESSGDMDSETREKVALVTRSVAEGVRRSLE